MDTYLQATLPVTRDQLAIDSSRNICIVAGGLAAPGGAERVACWLGNTFARQGIKITIVTLGPDGEPFFGLDHSVRLLPIGHKRQEKNILRSAVLCMGLTWKLRKALKGIKPDVVISFLHVNNILTLLASRGLNSTVIVSERTDPHARRLPKQWDLLRRLTYPWADSLVAQTEHALSFFPQEIRVRGQVIPNPVLPPNGAPVTQREKTHDKPYLILMGLGSLRKVKGFDRLIEAFSRIAGKHPQWKLMIYGEGPCRTELERQVQQLGLAGRVELPGVTRDAYKRLCDADLFVLCSQAEGFPNALAEAMACGLPVISFDCQSGPRELIRDGVDGVLVAPNDTNALAEQMDRLMTDDSERERLALRAPEVLGRFSSERVLAMWQSAVLEAVARP